MQYISERAPYSVRQQQMDVWARQPETTTGLYIRANLKNIDLPKFLHGFWINSIRNDDPNAFFTQGIDLNDEDNNRLLRHGVTVRTDVEIAAEEMPQRWREQIADFQLAVWGPGTSIERMTKKWNQMVFEPVGKAINRDPATRKAFLYFESQRKAVKEAVSGLVPLVPTQR